MDKNTIFSIIFYILIIGGVILLHNTNLNLLLQLGNNQLDNIIVNDNLNTNETIQVYKYVNNGHRGFIKFSTFDGVNQYLYNKEITRYEGNEKDAYFAALNNGVQDRYLNNLILSIQNESTNKDDQVRIASSLVQNLPYHDPRDTYSVVYPYEVVANNGDVCEGKSLLLSYILKRMGYGVALLVYDEENHMAVGIKTIDKFSYKNTGYAFIETTSPSIITDDSGEFSFGKISSTPRVIIINDGNIFENLTIEYNDATLLKHLDEISSGNDELSASNYRKYEFLMYKYGIEFNNEYITEDPSNKPLCDDNEALCNDICFSQCDDGSIPICENGKGVCHKSISYNNFDDINRQNDDIFQSFNKYALCSGIICNDKCYTLCDDGSKPVCAFNKAICYQQAINQVSSNNCEVECNGHIYDWYNCLQNCNYRKLG